MINVVILVINFIVVSGQSAHFANDPGKGNSRGSALNVLIGTSKLQAKRLQQVEQTSPNIDANQEQSSNSNSSTIFSSTTSPSASFISRISTNAFLVNQGSQNKDFALKILEKCPALKCYGLDCKFTAVHGCRTCICPIGSPARGCDRLPQDFWSDLTLNGCPNPRDPNGPRSPPRKVIRWYRHTDEEKGTSECRYYIFPYCNESDYNFWRSPRTKAECSHYCFHKGVQNDVSTEPPLL